MSVIIIKKIYNVVILMVRLRQGSNGSDFISRIQDKHKVSNPQFIGDTILTFGAPWILLLSLSFLNFDVFVKKIKKE